MLPRRPGQSPEQRARDMESALYVVHSQVSLLFLSFAHKPHVLLIHRDWMRNSGVEPDEDNPPIVDFGTHPSVSTDRRSPEERAKDLESMLQWLRNGKDNVDDPEGNFQRIDKMLPQKVGRSPLERAHDLDQALNWLRINGTSPVFLDGDVPEFSSYGSIPMSRRSPDDREQTVDDILTWIRGGKSDSNDPTLEFKKVDQMIPTKAGQTPENRARALEGALDWMRNHGFAPVDDAPAFNSMIDSVPMSRRSPEERTNDIETIMNWFRNGSPESEDPNGDFKRVDQMLPRKHGQSPEDRARQIEGVMDWMRNTGVKPTTDEGVVPFDKLASLPISRRSPEERSADRDDMTAWIRNGKAATDDPTGDFKKIDQLLGAKANQSPEDRARDLEGAL